VRNHFDAQPFLMLPYIGNASTCHTERERLRWKGGVHCLLSVIWRGGGWEGWGSQFYRRKKLLYFLLFFFFLLWDNGFIVEKDLSNRLLENLARYILVNMFTCFHPWDIRKIKQCYVFRPAEMYIYTVKKRWSWKLCYSSVVQIARNLMLSVA
jgi:hypothetical protein